LMQWYWETTALCHEQNETTRFASLGQNSGDHRGVSALNSIVNRFIAKLNIPIER
jgi:hypothetical protein